MALRVIFRWLMPAHLRRAARVFALLALGALAACSSVSLRPWGESPTQNLELVAADVSGAPRAGLHCRLRNDKGEWQVTVPGTVEVARSGLPLQIDCTRADGTALPRTDISATDERRDRAVQSAKKFSLLGVAGTIAFLGAFALTPAAIVYMAVGGATVGGMAAAEQATADTVTGAGSAYPPRIELRF
jgi:hypothetical protein